MALFSVFINCLVDDIISLSSFPPSPTILDEIFKNYVILVIGFFIAKYMQYSVEMKTFKR